jgi:hypothetical protein
MGAIKYLLSLLLILIPATSLADTHNAASCSRNDVNTAITASANGDTVTVPAGECDWGTSYISVTKAIKIIGAGSGSTILTGAHTVSNGGFFVVNTGATSGTFPFRISGIRFNTTGTYIVLVTGGGSGWQIDNNIFYKASLPNAYGVKASATGTTDGKMNLYGVINSNTFTHTKVYMEGVSATTANDAWTQAAQWGTDKAIFIEGNTFTTNDSSPSDSANSIDSHGGARYVIRYNTFNDGRVETHSACEASVRGTRSMEVYNNVFNGASSAWMAWIRHRGGSLVATKNLVSGRWNPGSGAVMMDNRRSTNDGSCTAFGFCNGESANDTNIENSAHGDAVDGYICLDQPGAGTGAVGSQTSDPIYIWGNVAGKVCIGGANVRGACTTDEDCPSSTCSTPTMLPNTVYFWGTGGNQAYHIVENRDYFLSEKSGWTPYTCPHPLASTTGSCATEGATMYGTTGYALTGGESDETAPTVLSVYVNGATMTINFSEAITSADNAAFTLDPSGADVTVDCPAVATGATSMACTISRALVQSETAKYAYTDTKVVDAATNPLANIGATDITGNLTPAEAPTSKLTVSKTGSGCTVTSSPSGISLGGATASDDFEFNTGTAVTLSGWSENGWNAITYGGDCAANGTVTMNADKECTATCTQVQLFP